jgi:hypothetical protein
MIYDDEKVMKISIFIHIVLGVSISIDNAATPRAKNVLSFIQTISWSNNITVSYIPVQDRWMDACANLDRIDSGTSTRTVPVV